MNNKAERMAFPGDGGHASMRQLPPLPALSSNRPFKKHIAPLEILSEATEETDAGFASEDTEYSLCTSPTCTKGSSSDEGAKLLVQPFGSSEKPLVYGHGAKASASKVAASNVQEISQSSAFKAAAEKARSKVSFQPEKAERSATMRSGMQMQRQMLKTSPTEAAAAGRSGSGTSLASRDTPRVDAHLQFRPPQSADSGAHVGANRCLPAAMSSRAAHFLHRHCSHALLKLRGIIQQQQEGDAYEDGGASDGDSVQGQRQRRPDPHASMDDVNEMKALLNTINQNLKMLETRGKAHPQLLSSKLAPVYFTT
ncbi:hypothetical protein L7F22_036299 [Adiantum nelumboides]|nr:hypothetical protein [Adiantum nelumboides]